MGQMANEVVITYETIFEILRREKSRDNLQELPKDFNGEVKKYLAQKKQTMLSLVGNQFSDLEQEKTQRQIINIKKILNELYERRERKLINMALNKSRMPKSVIDTTNLAEHEKWLFDKLILTFNDARSDALKEVLLENIHSEALEETKVAVESQQNIELQQTENTSYGLNDINQSNPDKVDTHEETTSYKISDGMQQVRFVCEVSQFVGPNLEIYGPFKSDELAVLPQSVCNVLLNKEKAEIIEDKAEEAPILPN